MRLALRPAPLWLGILLIAAGFSQLAAEDSVVQRPDPRGSRSLTYQDGVLVEVAIFGPDSSLLEEDFFRQAVVVERRIYVRSGGKLVRIDVLDARGTRRGGAVYRYDAGGALLSVSMDGSFGSGSAGMLAAGMPPLAAWTEDRGQVMVVRYDDRGRSTLAAIESDGSLRSSRATEYGAGDLPATVTSFDASSSTTTVTSFDESGRPILIVASRGGSELSRTQRRYDAGGRLVEETTRAGGSTTIVRTAYDSDGTTRDQELYRDGQLFERIRDPGPNRTEELYQNGDLFVKVHYLNGRKIKEEFFVDGSLAWTREYQ